MIVFGPRAGRRVSRRASDAIIGAFVAICRVGHVINTIMFYHETAFVHPRPYSLPFLGNMDTFLHCPGFNPEQIVFEFTHPDIETVVKTVEIHVFPAVVIDEKSVVDTLLPFDHRFPFLLHEWSQRRIGHCDTDMRLRGEKHIECSVYTINLRSPEPAVSVYVVLMQGRRRPGRKPCARFADRRIRKRRFHFQPLFRKRNTYRHATE